MSARVQESVALHAPAEVSVLVAAHQRPDTLKVALDSVFAQKDVCVEVIVVNDVAEPDPVDDVVRAYPSLVYLKDARYHTLSIKHLVGLELARAEYVHFLDDDDYVTDVRFFRKAVDRLKGDAKLALVAGSCDLRIEEGSHDVYRMENCPNEVLGVVDGLEMFQSLQTTRRKPAAAATVFRKSALALDEPLVEASDSSLFLKALLAGDAYILPDTVAVYRVWQDSMTRGRGNTFDFKLNVMNQKESLLRQAKGRIRDPLGWWNLTFQMNYRYFKKSFASEEERISFLAWGLAHVNESSELKAFILNELTPKRRPDTADVDGHELRKRLQSAEKDKAGLWQRLQAAERAKGELWTQKQSAEKDKAGLWQRLQEAERAKGELWAQKQSAEKDKAELWQRLQAAERAKGELWAQKRSAEKDKAGLWQRLQAAEKARGELLAQKQSAEKDKAGLWQRLQAVEKAKGEQVRELQLLARARDELRTRLRVSDEARVELWRQKSAAEKAKAELYVRLQEKEVRRRALEQVLEQVAKVI